MADPGPRDRSGHVVHVQGRGMGNVPVQVVRDEIHIQVVGAVVHVQGGVLECTVVQGEVLERTIVQGGVLNTPSSR